MQKWDYNDYVAGDDGGDTDGYDANRKGNADSVQQLKKKTERKKTADETSQWIKKFMIERNWRQ